MRQRIVSGVALAAFYFFAWSVGAFGSPVVCQSAIKAAAFTYQTPIVGGYYMPAEELQQRAAAQQAMEASPDLEAFRQFQAFREWEAWRSGQAEQLETPAAEPPAAPAAESLGAFGSSYPTLMAKCSKCHSGADPDGGFILDGSADLTSAPLIEARDKIMRETVNRRMPRKAGTADCVPLTPEEMGAVVGELFKDN